MDQLNQPTNLIFDKEIDSIIIRDWWNSGVVQRSCCSDTLQDEIRIDNIRCWGLAMDKQKNLYASDAKKHEVRRFPLGDKQGAIVAGGNNWDTDLNQPNYPTNIFVDRDKTVDVPDSSNYCVMQWQKVQRNE